MRARTPPLFLFFHTLRLSQQPPLLWDELDTHTESLEYVYTVLYTADAHIHTLQATSVYIWMGKHSQITRICSFSGHVPHLVQRQKSSQHKTDEEDSQLPMLRYSFC